MIELTKVSNSSLLRRKSEKLVVLLLLFLTVCPFPLPAAAKYSGGTSKPNDPYQITTAIDLMLFGESPENYDKHFILTDDINLDPNLLGRKVFDKAVIAPDTNDVKFAFQGTDFVGIFDGNGHIISNMTIEGGGGSGTIWNVGK